MKLIKRSLGNIYIKSLLVSIGIFLFTYQIVSWLFYTLDRDFNSLLSNIINQEKKISKDIIIVKIDDYSIEKIWYPIPRTVYAKTIDNLKEAWSSLIWFDVLFLDKWPNIAQDKILAESIRKAGNVIIWWAVYNWDIFKEPYELFKEWALDIWFFQPFVDNKNSKVYSIAPFYKFREEAFSEIKDNFAFLLLKNYYKFIYNYDESTIDRNIKDSYYNFFNKNIPVRILWEDQGEKKYLFDINYISPWEFNSVSFYDVYKLGEENKEIFKDKIIIIWATAEWVKDDFIVPYYGTIKWVYLHANVVNNVLTSNFVIYFDKNLELIIWFLVTLIIIYSNLFYIKITSLKSILMWSLLLFLTILVIYISFYIIGSKRGIHLVPNYPIEFVIILFLSFIASYVFRYVLENKNRKKLSKALSEYVSMDIANEILNESGKINLAWEKKRVVLFFSDIAGFTSISEKMEAEELVWFLREYIWSMSNIIMDNKWFINKYEWDAIMAIWWVFSNKSEDIYLDKNNVLNACMSIIMQKAKLSELNLIWKAKYGHSVNIRIWLHIWEAVLGNIWSEWRKIEFTAIWDNVNLASRLEWVNKFYGTEICLSEDAYNEAKDIYDFRFLDKIKVKWKDIPINIYELLGIKWKVPGYKKQIVSDFDNAMKLYLSRDFEWALKIFTNLSKSGDAPSTTFIWRCKTYIDNPPPTDWDQVWRHLEK